MHARLSGVLAWVVLVVMGCASTPATRVVLPHPADVAGRAAQARTDVTVRLRRLTLPGYLEDFPVVVGRRGDELVVTERIEWGERMTQGVERVLREALSLHLGPSSMLMPGDHRLADADLTIEFLSLDPVEGMLHLHATWFFWCRASHSGHGGRTRLEIPMEAESATAVANATTGALVRLADVLAAEMRCDVSNTRLQHGRPE